MQRGVAVFQKDELFLHGGRWSEFSRATEGDSGKPPLGAWGQGILSLRYSWSSQKWL